MHTTHENNFDFLRLLAALLVWYGNCQLLRGGPESLKGLSFQYLGVSILFIISGYFITASYERHGTPLSFLKNRALRVMPALVLALGVSALLIGPIASTLKLHDYYEHERTWSYFRNLLLFNLQPDLPGVFGNLPSNAVNGSLWVMPYEARCYAVIMLVGMLGILQPRVMLALFGCCLAILVTHAFCGDNPPKSLLGMKWEKLRTTMWLGFLFSGGGLVYMYRERIPRHIGLLTGCVLLMLFSLGLPVKWGTILLDATLIYSVIYIGFLRLPLLPRISQHGDFSYGIYLYAFPVQQLTLYLMDGAKTPMGMFMLVSLLGTLACALASWHLVEKRALMYKN